MTHLAAAALAPLQTNAGIPTQYGANEAAKKVTARRTAEFLRVLRRQGIKPQALSDAAAGIAG